MQREPLSAARLDALLQASLRAAPAPEPPPRFAGRAMARVHEAAHAAD